MLLVHPEHNWNCIPVQFTQLDVDRKQYALDHQHYAANLEHKLTNQASKNVMYC